MYINFTIAIRYNIVTMFIALTSIPMISLLFSVMTARDSAIDTGTKIITQILSTICHTEALLVEITSDSVSTTATVMIERLAGYFCWKHKTCL